MIRSVVVLYKGCYGKIRRRTSKHGRLRRDTDKRGIARSCMFIEYDSALIVVKLRLYTSLATCSSYI